MKKIFRLFLVVLAAALIPVVVALIIFLCPFPEEYEFLNPTNEVAEISLVVLYFTIDGDLMEKEIQKIDDTEAFLEDFQKVNCYIYFGDPIPAVHAGHSATVVKVSYENDEYELINFNGQSEYTHERGFSYYAGFNQFDMEQFKSLIKKYLSDGGT